MRESAFFFYGTLMDRDLLSAVLGRRVWPHALSPAVLRGYRRSSVRGASYPVVLRQRGASVVGVILRDPTVVLRGLAPAPQAVGDESRGPQGELSKNCETRR